MVAQAQARADVPQQEHLADAVEHVRARPAGRRRRAISVRMRWQKLWKLLTVMRRPDRGPDGLVQALAWSSFAALTL